MPVCLHSFCPEKSRAALQAAVCVLALEQGQGGRGEPNIGAHFHVSLGKGAVRYILDSGSPLGGLSKNASLLRSMDSLLGSVSPQPELPFLAPGAQEENVSHGGGKGKGDKRLK